MSKIRYVIVGSGWRALYYVRIAKALPDRFELCAMLCRSEEKAHKMAEDYNIHTTTSIEECKELNPDFVVVVVNKSDIAKVGMEWMNYGFTVLCETPAALDTDTLKCLWELHKSGKKLIVAEQYTRYPTYDAMLKVLKTGIIGEPDCLNISLAHEYHGANLIRAFLHQKVDVQFTVRAKIYEFTTTETLNRYECFTDGRIADKKRTVATFEFSDGKVAFYDFDSEQYRSPIRKNHVKVQGRLGELKDDTFYYLDRNYQDRKAVLEVTERCVYTGDSNPNLSTVREIVNIDLKEEDRGAMDISGVNVQAHNVYEATFGVCGLSEDETAIARLMAETAQYSRGEGYENNGESIAVQRDRELREALQDAYTAILMAKAVETGETVASEVQPWQCE